MRRLALLSLLAAPLLATSLAAAQSEVGEVSFANSGSAAAQEPFLRGLALLHNFEYPDAAEAFRQAQAIDPGFAMAYWGEAMTYNHPVWAQQDAAAAAAALGRLGATPEARLAKAKTERERDYLRAAEILYGTANHAISSGGPGGSAGSQGSAGAHGHGSSGSAVYQGSTDHHDKDKEARDLLFADAMAALHQRYPEDVDATAFYALALLGTAHQGRDFATYMRSAALLEEVFPTHPRHPGVLHYLIHSYDDPIHAPLGMRAARLYGGVAPNAAHALHMTSHIFIALGLWDDVIAANENATRVGDMHSAARHKPPGSCGHYAIWLHYAYLQERRFDAAERMLDACRKAVAGEVAGSAGSFELDDYLAGSWAQMRLVHAIETGRWDAASAALPPKGGPYAGALFTLAYGEALAAAGGDLPVLRAAAARLRERQKDLLATIEKGRQAIPDDSPHAAIAVQQIEALLSLREGKQDAGIALLRKAAEAESALPLDFGPPAIEKPTFELLGDELLALGRDAEAEAAYQSALARAPGRTRSLQGLLRAQQALRRTEAAERTQALLQRYVHAARAGGGGRGTRHR
jgi:tetratricopeptide (TPR) repeat protein